MKKENIKTQYKKFHDIYTQNLSSENEISNTLFHTMINFNLTGKKVLDIGCGDGVDLALLAKRGALVHGIDPCDEFLEKAQINNPHGIFINGIGEHLPFEEKVFDVVISKWAMQTSTNIPQILYEMARVLKKDGMLIFLSKHPFIQFLEKIRDYGHGANYYEQKIVTSNIYNGKIILKEPSHTFGEYFNKEFYSNFEILDYREGTDFPASEQLNNDIYPTFMIIVARKK